MLMVFVDDSEEKKPRRTPLGHLVGVGGVVAQHETARPPIRLQGRRRVSPRAEGQGSELARLPD